MTHRSLRFDPQDYQLLTMINRTVTKSRAERPSLMPQLSPSGILELAVPAEMRMASAVLRLLDTLAQGHANDRLEALAALHDEVLVMARTSLRINTGRVLVQLMKELVRSHDDFETQLRLAHDFRQAATGRHDVVRRLLHRYYMLEMPEDWNQAVFDNHVHDANTKGRKNATHLIILEGISGTGKSSLPRYFSKFIGEEAFFEPIQVTYKEKSDLLGYYNEFTRKYMETPFLRRLYQATYTADRLNLMVLDEMNISRVEYYFADFLSVLEFPEDERRVSLLTLPEDYDSPRHLRDGQMDLLPNTYFIGTCNKDDSTYTVTDKVIDRAVIIDFETYQREIAVDRDVSPILLSYAGLSDLFRKAEEDSDLRFSEEDRSRFLDLLAFMEEEFAIALGNRLLRQVEKMTPVYQAIGRKKDELLDYLFATKVLRKLQGRMDSSLTLSLRRLSDKIDSLYGKEAFLLSRKQIERTIQRLGL